MMPRLPAPDEPLPRDEMLGPIHKNARAHTVRGCNQFGNIVRRVRDVINDRCDLGTPETLNIHAVAFTD